MNRKVIALLIAAVFVIGGIAFAGALNEQDQHQGQGQIGINKSVNVNENDAHSSSRSKASALSGSIAAQKQIANGEVNVSDNSRTKTTAISFPSTGASEGVASANATYMFGNLGLSDTEMYKKGMAIIQTILAIPDNVLEPELKTAIVKDVVSKIRESIRPRRLLGIGPVQHSKNLLNLFGLLYFDSLWDEGQKPFQSKSDIE